MRKPKLKKRKKLACNNKSRRLRQIKKRKLQVFERKQLAFVVLNED